MSVCLRRLITGRDTPVFRYRVTRTGTFPKWAWNSSVYSWRSLRETRFPDPSKPPFRRWPNLDFWRMWFSRISSNASMAFARCWTLTGWARMSWSSPNPHFSKVNRFWRKCKVGLWKALISALGLKDCHVCSKAQELIKIKKQIKMVRLEIGNRLSWTSFVRFGQNIKSDFEFIMVPFGSVLNSIGIQHWKETLKRKMTSFFRRNSYCLIYFERVYIEAFCSGPTNKAL